MFTVCKCTGGNVLYFLLFVGCKTEICFIQHDQSLHKCTILFKRSQFYKILSISHTLWNHLSFVGTSINHHSQMAVLCRYEFTSLARNMLDSLVHKCNTYNQVKRHFEFFWKMHSLCTESLKICLWCKNVLCSWMDIC